MEPVVVFVLPFHGLVGGALVYVNIVSNDLVRRVVLKLTYYSVYMKKCLALQWFSWPAGDLQQLTTHTSAN